MHSLHVEVNVEIVMLSIYVLGVAVIRPKIRLQ